MAHLSNANDSPIAASVAPEDLRCGDYVAALNEIYEYPSFLWCDVYSSTPEEVVRIRCRAANSGTPMKVKAICLPFVYVKSPKSKPQTIDIRRVQLVRLRKRYAKAVWQGLRKRAK